MSAVTSHPSEKTGRVVRRSCRGPVPGLERGADAAPACGTYPSLPAHAARITQLVPSGWTLEKQVHGDLNGDGCTDAALLLRDQDPANVIHHAGLGDNPLNTNPRILASAGETVTV